MFDLTEILVMVGVSLISAIACFTITLRSAEADSAPVDMTPEAMAFLFDDGVLHHATQEALTYFRLLPGAHVWDDLRQSLVSRFPQFPDSPTSETIGSMTIQPLHEHDRGLLTLSWRDSLCWVKLTEADKEWSRISYADFETLKAISDTSPHPAWETCTDGRIGWRNAAYQSLSKRCNRSDDAPLFDFDSQDGEVRAPLEISPGVTEWYALTSHQTADSMVHHASCITHLIQAEDAQRTFVQTLAKTFAQLPIGLAIFDRNSQMSIFNPALVELSGLQPQYLAGKPTVLSFFDALRENRRMPEPKNYNTWRNDISAMIAAAADGRYDETWTLEDGRTYTVQGRPHPDGAIAFLIEDISGAVTLTRNFRTEVSQYEAILNSVEDAFIVFSAGGVVTFSNEAYQKMWGQNPEAAFADVTVQDAIGLWQTRVDTDLSEIADFIKTSRTKAELELCLKSKGKKTMSAKLSRVGLDLTMVRFSVVRAGADRSVATIE